MITLSNVCKLCLPKIFKKIFNVFHLILTVQSSITNIVSGRPDAADQPPSGRLISSADGYEARQKWRHCLTANKEDKASRRGHSVSHTPLNKHVMAERTARLMEAPMGKTSSF